MLTLIAIWADIKFKDFEPQALYIGTVLIDLAVIYNI